MTIHEQISAAITDAMRAGDAFRRDTLRMVVNTLYLTEKKEHRPLSEDEALGILAKEIKARHESADVYRAAGRVDLAEREEAEIAQISGFMPAALSDEAISALVDEAIEAVGATSPKDMGKVMGYLTPRTRGRADGKMVASMVTIRLSVR